MTVHRPMSGPMWFDSLKFDDDVPIPTSRGPGGELAKALKDMKVGQSFLMPYTRKPVAGNLARATGWKFTQAREGESLRIWRIK